MKGVKNMKKQYVKPELYFENFELSMNIAAGCAIATQHADYVCPYTITSMNRTIFSSKESGCTTLTQDGSEYGLCYHNPAEGQNLFSS